MEDRDLEKTGAKFLFLGNNFNHFQVPLTIWNRPPSTFSVWVIGKCLNTLWHNCMWLLLWLLYLCFSVLMLEARGK